MADRIPPEAGALLNLRRILVPIDGSDIAYSALALACDIAKRNHGQVYAVHVIVVKRTLPLDAEMVPETRYGNELLARAERLGGDWGVPISTELLQARDTATSIVDEAESLEADAIFLGLELKQRIGEPTVGAKVDYLLREANCQVWIFRNTLSLSADA